MNSINNHPMRVFPLLVLLLSSIDSIQAQSPPPPDDQYQYARFSPSMAIIIVVLIAALFLMGFFSIYIRRCSNDSVSNRAGLSMRRAGRLAMASRGLDAGILETFPTFAYSTVKGLKIGKGALECAVCLNEFEDEETIRLIPKCDHVFHAECIDAWLENHVTCPVCRSNLVNSSTDSTHGAGASELGSGADVNNQLETLERENNTSSVSILVGDENFAHVPNQDPVLKRIKSAHPYRPPRSRSVRGPEKFRSHSTGHSLVQLGEDTERFTLRLPENVRKQVISDALLNRSVKFAREGSGRKGYRTTGEGSSKGRSFRRMGSIERSVFSKAPSFLSRAFSVRSQKTTVTGNAGASTSDEAPLNNIGPKSDEVGGRPPV